MNSIEQLAKDYPIEEDEKEPEQIELPSKKPRRKNKPRTFCKVCGPEATDHFRCTKYKCPKHKDYVSSLEKSEKPKRGRPVGTARKFCKLCGPEVTDHVNCSKKKCPQHPEYKERILRAPNGYNIFVKTHFQEVKEILKKQGKDGDFGETMKLTGILWNYQKDR